MLVGCVLNRPTVLSLPLEPHDIRVLEETAYGVSGWVSTPTGVLGEGSSFSFSESEVSFVDTRDIPRILPLVPSTSLTFPSAKKGLDLGVSRGFLVGALFGATAFLMTAGGEDTESWMVFPAMGVTGFLGGLAGAFVGSIVGGHIRFEFSGSGGASP
jgi:hypothetical protein